MIFLVDEAIPFAQEAFSTLGEVRLSVGKDIKNNLLKSVDALVVRTLTKINSDLLSPSEVRFVGTTTIGTDHVDLPLLERRGIKIASAPGCNAAAVAEFIITALVTYERERGGSLKGKILGIIGAGNTGTELKKRAEMLGMTCLLNDPPLKERTGSDCYLSLKEVLKESSIISLHTPLIKSGTFPTYHLIDSRELKLMSPDTILINTSRGSVINNKALLSSRDRIGGVILDVWEDEPTIIVELLRKTDIATPHIAGYSAQGKLRATEAVYREACGYFNTEKKWRASEVSNTEITLEIDSLDGEDWLHKVLSAAYDIKKDDTTLRNVCQQTDPGNGFSVLRDKYSFRNEWSTYTIANKKPVKKKRREILKNLGFSFTTGNTNFSK